MLLQIEYLLSLDNKIFEHSSIQKYSGDTQIIFLHHKQFDVLELSFSSLVQLVQNASFTHLRSSVRIRQELQNKLGIQLSWQQRRTVNPQVVGSSPTIPAKYLILGCSLNSKSICLISIREWEHYPSSLQIQQSLRNLLRIDQLIRQSINQVQIQGTWFDSKIYQHYSYSFGNFL